mmetsp:Transcript_1869/g.3389  ORF Transcript_1869/g.3389 Transcript_1869/m.3389 type:complete len:554 (-) Transcript_1869:100-1761(-)
MRASHFLTVVMMLSWRVIIGQPESEATYFQFREVTSEVGIVHTAEDKTSGPSVGDLDQDGYLDFIQSQHAHHPVEVYYGSANGKFRRELAFETPGDRHGTAIGDLDGNGKLDIILAIGGAVGLNPLPPRESRTAANGTLYEVDEAVSGLGGRNLRGVAARLLDIDQDGDLDLFVMSRPQRDPSILILHAVYENLGGEPLSALESGTLNYSSKVMRAVDDVEFYKPGTLRLIPFTGIETCKAQTGFLMTDFDSDGIPDLILLSPTVNVFRGTGKKTFEDVTSCVLPNGIFQLKGISGAVELDIDNDGDMDIYLSGGSRYKGPFSSGSDLLLENLSETRPEGCSPFYRDISATANIPQSGARAGITAADFNNDGFMDIYLPEIGPADQRLRDTVLMNLGNKTFVQVRNHGADGPLVGDPTFPTGAQAFDYDRDGLVDVLVASRFNDGQYNLHGHLRLFKNTKRQNNYVIVKVPLSMGGKTTMDATLMVNTAGGSFYRRVGSVGEFRTQSFVDQVHFGLGKNAVIDSIILKLMDGNFYRAQGGPANRMVSPIFFPI